MQFVASSRRLQGRRYRRQRPQRARPRVAYLTNAYPKPSHSFIRREILALERQGFDVLRMSIRSCGDALPDSADQMELGRTRILLNRNYLELVLAFGLRLLTHPLRLAQAVLVTLGMAGTSGLVRACAYLLEACLLVRVLEAAGIRHVHVHFGTNPAAVARLARALGEVTYSMTLHGPDEFDEPRTLLLSEKVASAAFVVAISSFCRGQLIRWTSAIDWPKIKVIRCGIELRSREETDGDGIAPGAESDRLVCVARLSAQKGLGLLLEAVAEVAREHRFHIRIVGDGELRPELEAQIVALGLQDHVTLLGWCSAGQVREEMLNARALILPSLAEGLPIVLIEALALGRPVVATCIAGIPELVDNECGYLVPAGSGAAIAGALREVLETNPGRLAAMGEIGRERVRRYHDVDRNAASLAELFRPLV